jgi:hypothetical protein
VQNTKIPKYQTVFCPKYQKSKRVPCKIPKNQTRACVCYSKFQRFKKRFDFLVFCLVGQIQKTKIPNRVAAVTDDEANILKWSDDRDQTLKIPKRNIFKIPKYQKNH